MPEAPESEAIASGRVQLVHAVGMHARPAVQLTKLAKRFASRILVRVGDSGEWIDAKSVVKLMAMRAPCGSWLEFEASGADAEAAVAAVVALIAADFIDPP